MQVAKTQIWLHCACTQSECYQAPHISHSVVWMFRILFWLVDLNIYISPRDWPLLSVQLLWGHPQPVVCIPATTPSLFLFPLSSSPGSHLVVFAPGKLLQPLSLVQLFHCCFGATSQSSLEVWYPLTGWPWHSLKPAWIHPEPTADAEALVPLHFPLLTPQEPHQGRNHIPLA